jgi:hypothetical protein
MQKVKFERFNKLTNQVEQVEIYDSIVPYRLDDESREDYKVRQLIIKYLEKRKKKQRNLFHVSSELIPLRGKDGEVILIQGSPKWIGTTKGNTFKKEKNEN